MSKLELLLQAAMFVDRRETELCDHGYASPNTNFRQQQQRQQQRRPKRRTVSSSSSTAGGTGIRSLHNELEKNRRANLRHCLERLRDSIPTHGPSDKNTTLQLLKRAKQHIMKLEEENQTREQQRKKLLEQGRQLSEHLKRRDSVGSSCSSSASSSPTYQLDNVNTSPSPTFRQSLQFLGASDTASSAPSVSDNDDVDIMGSTSDYDEYSR